MSARQEGFILVAALWMLAALAGLASAYAVYAVQTAPGATLSEERLRAEAAIRAGAELVAGANLAFPKAARPDVGGFSTRVGEARLDVAWRAESARVDLNQAPPKLLAGLFAALGAPDTQAQFLAERIGAWRGKLDDDARRNEAAIYAKAGLAYAPPGAPFDNVLEISLLPQMTPALARRAAAFLTVFGAAKIDPFVADPTVLAALPGVTPGVLKTLAAAGPRPDKGAFAALAGPVGEFVSPEAGAFVRADIAVLLAGRRVHAELVLKLLDEGAVPFEIVFWRDDFDGEAG